MDGAAAGLRGRRRGLTRHAARRRRPRSPTGRPATRGIAVSGSTSSSPLVRSPGFVVGVAVGHRDDAGAHGGVGDARDRVTRPCVGRRASRRSVASPTRVGVHAHRRSTRSCRTRPSCSTPSRAAARARTAAGSGSRYARESGERAGPGAIDQRPSGSSSSWTQPGSSSSSDAARPGGEHGVGVERRRGRGRRGGRARR